MIRVLCAVAAVAALTVAGHTTAVAQPYRWVDASGVIHYSDQWPRGATGAVEDLSRAARARRNYLASRAAAIPEVAPHSRPAETAARTVARREAEELVQELVTLSGLDRQLRTIAFRVGLTTDRLRSRTREVTRSGIVRAFRYEALVRYAADVVGPAVDRSRASAVLAALRSPLFVRIQGLENEAMSAAGQDDFESFVSGLAVVSPPTARLRMVQRLDRALAISEQAVGIATVADRAVAQMLSDSAPSAERLLDDRDGRRAGDLHETVRFAAVTVMLFAYRDLTDSELEQYVKFWESPTGRWFAGIHRTALLQALDRAYDDAMVAIGRATAETPGGSGPSTDTALRTTGRRPGGRP